MHYRKGSWLGWAVLLSAVLAITQMAVMPNAVVNFPAVCFLFLGFGWVVRATVRALGRAWHHSAQNRAK